MIAPALLQSIYELPTADKLSLLGLITQMLQKEFVQSRNGTTLPEKRMKSHRIPDEQQMKALIMELLSRPNPPPEKMLPRGLFKGKLSISEEDFKLAEWHPSEEELAGG